LRAPVVLVLDDYQAVDFRECHKQVEGLLRDLPWSVRVVIMTRATPPLELARLRAAGELADIGMRELRFSRSEAGALVSAVAGVTLAGPDLSALLARTEGWPAGLYLAALSLRGHPSPHSFIDQFTGNNRFVADFLAEEVLSRQALDVRQFLLRTCILDRFTAPLCDAVTGRADSAQLIERLERENLFLIPADEQRVWYRYHCLFAQMLRGRLPREEPGPGLVSLLHRRASAWHREAGSVQEAITHGLAAGDAAWVAAVSWDADSVRRWLRVIEAASYDGGLPDGIRSLTSSAAMLHATFGFNGVRAMVEDGITATELEDDPASSWYAHARALLGFALHLAGDPGATPVLERALAAGTGRPLTRIVALSVAAFRAADDGEVARARELAEKAARIVNGAGFSTWPPSSFILAALGTVHSRQGRLEEARSEFEYAIHRRRQLVLLTPWLSVELQLRLAQVLLAMDDRVVAATVLAEVRDVLTASPDGAGALLARLGELERLLAGTPSAPSPDEALSGPLTKPLTKREQAVLGLLRKSMSVSEIARELYISANTVKTHKRAIYRKLDASSRQQAIERVPE
jgi:LuxR family maltose regulon positive regulatory protein